MKIELKGGNITGLKNITRNPSPTIMAGGIGGVGHGQYIISGGGGGMKNNNKPPYKLLSMANIERVDWNGFNVVSTFSGCGGSCLGFRMAGFNVLWANEFVEIARQSYSANHPRAFLNPLDLRIVTAEQIRRESKIGDSEIDVFEGSPPCVDFSTAGKRAKGWGKERQHSDGSFGRADDLFFVWCALLKKLQPKTFIAENVSGLVKGVAKGYFKEIIRVMRDCGYAVEAKLLDAQWLGVPQTRSRIIFIGIRKDLADRVGIKPEFPKPLSYRYSVTDAISDLISPMEKPEKPVPTITAHRCADTGFNPPPKILIRHGTGYGKERFVENGISQTIETSPSTGVGINGGMRIKLVYDTRGQWDVKSFSGGDSVPAITTRNAHHLKIENRKLTIAEVKRICSFPDDFVLKGSYSQQWARLGNSVPPVMMFHIAMKIRGILEKIRDETP